MKWSALRSEKDLEVMVQETENVCRHIWTPATASHLMLHHSLQQLLIRLVATLAIEGIVPES